METFNEDPKPGRLVLPLVLIGMIATTYTFINRVSTDNNLEIEPVVDDIVETIEIEPEEETTTTTTTTLPDEVVTYCLLYTSPSPRDVSRSRMPSSA